MIGQHIGYRYDVNLLPDYKKVTPFLKKYIVGEKEVYASSYAQAVEQVNLMKKGA